MAQQATIWIETQSIIPSSESPIEATGSEIHPYGSTGGTMGTPAFRYPVHRLANVDKLVPPPTLYDPVTTAVEFIPNGPQVHQDSQTGIIPDFGGYLANQREGGLITTNSQPASQQNDFDISNPNNKSALSRLNLLQMRPIARGRSSRLELRPAMPDAQNTLSFVKSSAQPVAFPTTQSSKNVLPYRKFYGQTYVEGNNMQNTEHMRRRGKQRLEAGEAGSRVQLFQPEPIDFKRYQPASTLQKRIGSDFEQQASPVANKIPIFEPAAGQSLNTFSRPNAFPLPPRPASVGHGEDVTSHDQTADSPNNTFTWEWVPSESRKTIFFHTSAVLSLQTSESAMGGWLLPQYGMIPSSGPISLLSFTELLRRTHGIGDHMVVEVLRVTIGGKTFSIDLRNPRGEFDWTMVMGCLFLGDDTMARVTTTVQTTM